MLGDADIAAIAAVVGEPSRARMLLALADGRALAASVLAQEAGVAPSTASEHLAKLAQAGLVVAEPHGRHRHYRLAGPQVGELIEALARAAPAEPIRSLRQDTRAHAIRTARTCYDHLAGRLGASLMGALLDQRLLSGGDGRFAAGGHDRLSAPGRDVAYRVTAQGRATFADFGIDVAALDARARPTVRYCVDWSEQRHHVAGGLGAALLARALELDWVRRLPRAGHRALVVTPAGRDGLAERFGLAWADAAAA